MKVRNIAARLAASAPTAAHDDAPDPCIVFLARAAARDRLVLEGMMAADEAVLGLLATSPAILIWPADDGGDDDLAQ